MKRVFSFIAGLLNDWFTTANGRDFAIGKGMGAVLFLVGAPLPWVWLFLQRERPLTIVDCGLFYASLAGAIAALIWGTERTERNHATPPADPAA